MHLVTLTSLEIRLILQFWCHPTFLPNVFLCYYLMRPTHDLAKYVSISRPLIVLHNNNSGGALGLCFFPEYKSYNSVPHQQI